jgi:hypothetical protein
MLAKYHIIALFPKKVKNFSSQIILEDVNSLAQGSLSLKRDAL